MIVLLWNLIIAVNVIYLNFSCTPDWHTEERMTSYVLWILILGFLLPTLVIVISSITTCITIREVSREIKIYSIHHTYNPCNDLSYQYSWLTSILFTVSWKHQVWGCSAVIFEEGSKSFSACSCNECWILDVLDSVWNIVFHSRLHFTNVIIWNF